MYPVPASGSLYDSTWPPHKIPTGAAAEAINLLGNGLASYALAATDPGFSTMAIRLAVAGASGGNVLATLNYPGQVWGTQRLDAGVHYTFVANGEPVYRDTNAATPQYGASSEPLTPTATTVTVTNGLTTITASGNAFGTGDAILNAGTYAAYHAAAPSLNFLRPGDIIRITDGGSSYYHRIASITSRTVAEIYPAYAGAGGAGKAYTLLRAGYASHSKIVPIYNSANGLFYNYYVGSDLSNAFPGTLMAFTREASGAVASTHFVAPQTNNGAGANVLDIQATDLAYYKTFLLYGYGGAISWSKAGFPTSFTTAFGADDFPATNVTVVANDDQFISFEYLGDQVIAIFKNSVWQVQATGSVPEFTFYRLPTVLGAYMPPIQDLQTAYFQHYRPSCSARSKIFYFSTRGLVQYAGSTFDTVSVPITADIQTNDLGTGYYTVWDSSNNVVVLGGTSNPTNNAYLYDITNQNWSRIKMGSPNGIGNNSEAFSSVDDASFRGLYLTYYDQSGEKINAISQGAGNPFTQTGGAVCNWRWTTPVVSMGDVYRGFQFAGFQVDGNVNSTCTWTQYGGKTPYSMTVRDSGTVSSTDNRLLLGKKIDDAFVQISLADNRWCELVGVNIYTTGRGK